MMQFLEILLSPIVLLMEFVLNLYIGVLSSVGFSILLLSFTLCILLLPLQNIGRRHEEKIRAKMQKVNEEVRKAKGTLRGEELFIETEKIYNKHKYHPIHSVLTSAGFLVSLPVLLSAILLFTREGVVTGQPFLVVDDLSKPDQLISSLNVLPLLMFLITFVDALIRYRGDRGSKFRFLLISIVLLILIYDLPSGLVLYWIGNNIMSFVLSQRSYFLAR